MHHSAAAVLRPLPHLSTAPSSSSSTSSLATVNNMGMTSSLGNGRITASEQVSALQAEVTDLRSRLLAKEQRINVLESTSEASEDVIAEWQAKYDRLFEAHRKLQKTNHSLEDKLLRIVDKFEADKNQMTRDLASQTQKLVQSKLTIQQLHDRNGDLQSDLNLSITLLQNRPSSYLAQRVDTLPSDMQARVRSYIADKHAERFAKEKVEGKRIRVPIMEDVDKDSVGENEKVSAAILAKVLEERAKERRKERKFCIDVGTQTHGWHFPEKLYHPTMMATQSPTSPQSRFPSNGGGLRHGLGIGASNGKVPGKPTRILPPEYSQPPVQVVPQQQQHQQVQSNVKVKPKVDDVIQILRSVSMEDTSGKRSRASPYQQGQSSHLSAADSALSNILLTSVIRSPPASLTSGKDEEEDGANDQGSVDTLPTSESSESASLSGKLIGSLINLGEESPSRSSGSASAVTSTTRRMTRSITFSTTETDI